MRYFDRNSFYVVYVSEQEVNSFNNSWPCSSLSGQQRFEFNSNNGDLIDHDGIGDGPELFALIEDAQKYARNKRKKFYGHY